MNHVPVQRTSTLPGWRAPAVGFEQPFDMLQACHERVLRMLALADGRSDRFSAADEALFERFAACYASHVEKEERLAYPQARGLLPEATQAAMGHEMAVRRGADLSRR